MGSTRGANVSKTPMATVCNEIFRSSTANTVQIDWASAWTIVRSSVDNGSFDW